MLRTCPWWWPRSLRRDLDSQAGTGRTYLRRVAADSVRIGVVRNQSRSTVSRTMYKATPKAMGTPITNSMTTRSGCGWRISHGSPGIEEAPVASK